MDLSTLAYQAVLLLKPDGEEPSALPWKKSDFADFDRKKLQGMQASWLAKMGAKEGQEAHCTWGSPAAPDKVEWVPTEQLAARLQAECAATGVILHTIGPRRIAAPAVPCDSLRTCYSHSS